MEAIPQVFDGTFGFGKTVVCTVPRNGDLVHRMYVKVGSNSHIFYIRRFSDTDYKIFNLKVSRIRNWWTKN